MAGENEAEAKAKATAEVKAKERGSHTFGPKKILLLVLGAVLVFLGSVPLHLYLNGVLSAKSPHLKAIPGYASVDSILAVEREKLREKEKQARLAAMEEAQAAHVADVQTTAQGESGIAPADVGQETAAGTGPTRDGSLAQTVGKPVDEAQETGVAKDAFGGDEVLQPEGTLLADPLLPFDPDKMSRLVTVYEKMRPKQVALILSTMPERQSVMILSGMKNQSAAKVLAEMEPGRAARMSELLVRWDSHE